MSSAELEEKTTNRKTVFLPKNSFLFETKSSRRRNLTEENIFFLSFFVVLAAQKEKENFLNVHRTSVSSNFFFAFFLVVLVSTRFVRRRSNSVSTFFFSSFLSSLSELRKQINLCDENHLESSRSPRKNVKLVKVFLLSEKKMSFVVLKKINKFCI